MWIRAVAACVLASAALFPAGVAADSGHYLPDQLLINPPGQPVITPPEAETLVKAIWQARRQALFWIDTINDVETQAAAEFNSYASLESALAYGQPGAVRTLTVFVPRQLTYPAFFLAVVTTHDDRRPDRREGLAFTRNDAGKAWKLAIDAPFDPEASKLGLVADADGYALPAAVGLTEVTPEKIYAAGLGDGSMLACYSYHSNKTSKRSWANPQWASGSRGLDAGYYTTVTNISVNQGCGVVTANGMGSSLGLLTADVGMTGSKEPPPWLPIGIAGLGIVAAAYALMTLLGRGLEPVPLDALDPAPTQPRRLTLPALQRRYVVNGGFALAIEGAVLIEIVRLVAESHLELGLLLLGAAVLWVALLLPPWLRRERATASLVIPASPAAVWSALVERGEPPLEPELVSVECLTPGPQAVGTKYRLMQRASSGLLFEVEMVITAFDPGHLVAESYPELWHPQSRRYVLTPEAEGTLVTVTHDLTIGAVGSISGGILNKAGMRRHTEEGLRGTLLRLKQRVTGDAASADGSPAAGKGGRFPKLGVGLAVMVGTALLSLGGYTLLFGAIFGALLMAVLLIHELGHFAEARRHGLSVRLPFFIPFIGAAVTMRNMPGDAATHARIALAGPLCGTLAVAVACVVAAPTNAQGIILFAQLGALINLLNLAPMSILDGGTILASLSRWIAVGGLLMAALLVVGVALSNQFSPLVLVIAGLAVYSVINRFRRHRTPYYRSVSRRARFVLGSVWFAVGGYLIVAGGATAVATLTW
jgi:Zn-dependent protease